MNTKQLFQVAVHLISMVFLYLLFKKKNTCKSFTHSRSILPPIDKQCFKQQCSKAATDNECNKYARCTWSNGSCKSKDVQCDELQPAVKHMDRFNCNAATHCKLSGDHCDWNFETLQSGPRPKIINETTGLNKYCSKRRGAFKIKNLNEFVEDGSYVQCVNDQNIDNDVCQQSAKIKLECNSIEGHTYNEAHATCRSLNFETSKVKDTKKVPPHHHSGEQLKNTGVIAKNMFVSDLFIIKHDTILTYYVNTLIVVLVILTNIGFARWINNA